MLDQEETTDKREQRTNALAWFLTGVVVGAAAALLYTPKSGRETRRLISEKTQQGRETVTGTTEDIVETGRDLFERGRRLVVDAADLFERGRKLVRG